MARRTGWQAVHRHKDGSESAVLVAVEEDRISLNNFTIVVEPGAQARELAYAILEASDAIQAKVKRDA